MPQPNPNTLRAIVCVIHRTECDAVALHCSRYAIACMREDALEAFVGNRLRQQGFALRVETRPVQRRVELCAPHDIQVG